MARKLLNLRHVPGDELEEIYELLQSHDIACYETSAGLFGISLPALWVRDELQWPKAQALLEEYSTERLRRAREQQAEAMANGQVRTLWQVFAERPVRFVVYLMIVVALVYVSTAQFWLATRPL
jgi:Family of unknown function (DUF6164)